MSTFSFIPEPKKMAWSFSILKVKEALQMKHDLNDMQVAFNVYYFSCIHTLAETQSVPFLVKVKLSH